MMKNINPVTIKLPANLEGRSFLTPAEFGGLVGRDKSTILSWGRKGWLRLRKFSPKCIMVPLSELERYMNGEMMEGVDAKN